VLFSPDTETGTSISYISQAEQSFETPGRSRLSDLGSLNTVARSEGRDDLSPNFSAAIGDESVEDDVELDSLDSHLPEFLNIPDIYSQQTPAVVQSVPVLPTHDGLGSFRLDRQGLSQDVQDQLYAFERFNPRRLRRRRESLDLAQLELEHDEEQEAGKMRRIEAWRLEQSRILLEEIQKETRRRRQSQTSTRPRVQLEDSAGAVQRPEHQEVDWHEQHAMDGDGQGFWSHITRKVIGDLMGIDERLISLLFGEALSDEDISSTPRASGAAPGFAESDSGWHLQVLERVSRELGLLVNQLSHHPGAFSTYSRMQQMPIPYAGLPAIPESAVDTPAVTTADEAMPSLVEFQPTITQQVQPIIIPGVRQTAGQADVLMQPAASAGGVTFTQEEWEQDLDIKLVFRYLRSRFTSRSSPATPFIAGTSHLATSSTQDTAAKAARVRQHHPLVRNRPIERRTSFKATIPTNTATVLRHASSCASQSTRRSARRSSVSSRHYWDIGGSLGTGSIIASVGPMGSWGEV
jgi:hypothetical protein